MLKQVGKIFLRSLVIAIGLGILGPLILFLTYLSEYVHHVLVWQESDVTSQSLKEDLHQGSLLRGGR